MSRLPQHLLQACKALDIKLFFDYEVQIGAGNDLQALAYLPEFGGRRGMLLFSSYDQIRDAAEQIQRAGYGYAVLDEPMPDEKFDLNVYREVFSDWGWTEREKGSGSFVE